LPDAPAFRATDTPQAAAQAGQAGRIASSLLAAELSTLIIAQHHARAYQANTKIITTPDQMP
jgi:flagellar hook protein FlgE